MSGVLTAASRGEAPPPGRVRYSVDYRVLAAVLLAVLAVIVAWTFRDYGLTWDEEFQSQYGESVLRWYGSLFTDRSALSEDNFYLYGGFFEGLAELLTRVLPFGHYEDRHLLGALFGLVAVASSYGLGAGVAGARAGFFSALFLAATPPFFGQIFNNPKDIPFAALFALSLHLALSAHRTLPRVPARLTLALGLAMGATLGVRIGGVLLFAYLGGLWLAGLRKGEGWRESLLGFLVAPIAIAWVVMLACWPWAQVSPLAHPLDALREALHFHADWDVLFDGRLVPAEHPPWRYLPVWFANVLPEFYALTLAAGALLAARRPRELPGEGPPLAALAVAVVLPVATAIAFRSTLYDGIRHFLFILPPLAALAGISFEGLLRSQAPRIVKRCVAGLVGLSLLLVLVDMVSLHPYESVYFNRLVCGGLRGASGRFETDYWGSSYKEGVEWVIWRYRPPTSERIRVANCSNQILTGYFLEKTEGLRRTFASVPRTQEYDVFLATTNRKCHQRVQSPLLHVVERQGVPLLYVFEAQRPRPGARRGDAPE